VAKYATEQGIGIARSAPYPPQANGKAERMNRTLIEAVRTTLKQSSLDREFWAEALEDAVGIRNCILRENGKSTYEELTGNKPDLTLFRPFGCLGIYTYMKARERNLKAKRLRA
jgi:hypothetical protein